MKRRKFINHSSKVALGASGAFMLGFGSCKPKEVVKQYLKEEKLFKISLAEWSFHQEIQAGRMDHLDFAHEAGKLGIRAIEYVSGLFGGEATDMKYLKELNMRANGEGVNQILIMVDGEGDLAQTDKKANLEAIESHKKWVAAAKHLDCHAIRVNLFGTGSPEEWQAASVDSLSILAEYAKVFDINVLVENHGGYSSHGQYLANVMKQVNMPNCGTLPDFGNFCIRRENDERWGTACVEEYDKYLGVEELLPYAKAVSAKSHDFNNSGQTTIDYERMLDLVVASGYNGYVGIEYEGSSHPEKEGIRLTYNLLKQYLVEHPM